VNYQVLAAQLVKARRGEITQKELSSELGYQSNVVFSWENQRDEPSARTFFRLAAITGDVPSLLEFYAGNACPDLSQRPGVTLFLRELLGEKKISHLSIEMARNRHVVGRWLRGQTEMPLSILLQFIEVCTGRLFDFLEFFVDPKLIDEISAEYQQLLISRKSDVELPWSHAIVRMVEFPAYKKLKKHQTGWFAQHLDITHEEEQKSIDVLVQLGRLRFHKNHYQSTNDIDVKSSRDLTAMRKLGSFWMREGAQRVLTPESGRFSYKALTFSEENLIKAKQLQREYMQSLLALSEKKQPQQALTLAATQIFTLYREPSSSK